MGRTRRDHYAALGVDPSATDGEIKAAYRAKAAETHPDKGGSTDAFAPVGEAWEVLRDPVRRALHDAGQPDEVLPDEVEAREFILAGFNSALQSDMSGGILAHVRGGVKKRIADLQEERADVGAQESRFAAKRGLVTVAEGKDNLYRGIVDQILREAGKRRDQIDRELPVMALALEMLAEYDEPGEGRSYGMTDAMEEIDRMIEGTGYDRA